VELSSVFDTFPSPLLPFIWLYHRFLVGDVEGAKVDLTESIKLVPSFAQSIVKIASVHMEQGNAKLAFECFDDAIKQNQNDPDIYYHRGQGTHRLFLTVSQST
jgi:tetratricopeptide (TPR) repeat protein